MIKGSFPYPSLSVLPVVLLLPTFVLGIFDPNTFSNVTFLESTQLRPARAGHCSIGTEVNQSIFFLGGYNDQQPNGIKDFWRFCMISYRWEQLQAPRKGRVHSMVSQPLDQSSIIVFGGLSPSNINPEVEEYDLQTQMWYNREPWSEPRYLGAVVIVGTRHYLIGGINASNISVTALDHFDSLTKTWGREESYHDLPYGLHSHVAFAIDNTMFVLGGVMNDSTVTNLAWKYQVGGDECWKPIPPMRHARKLFSHVTRNQMFFVLGGIGPDGLFVNITEGYDMASGRWYDLTDFATVGLYDMSVTQFQRPPQTVVIISGGINKSHEVSSRVVLFNVNPISIEDLLAQTNDGRSVLTSALYAGIASAIVACCIFGYVYKMLRTAKDCDAVDDSFTHRHHILDPQQIGWLGDEDGNGVGRKEDAMTIVVVDETFSQQNDYSNGSSSKASSPRNNTNNNNQTVYGAFQRAQLIGRGSYGTVYVGIRPTDGSLIAVKVIQLVASLSEEALEAIVREVQLMRNLPSHDNIIQYLGCTVSRETHELNILMEYAEGGSLGHICRKLTAPLSEAVVRKYTLQILQGLAFLHAHDVIHRDIKADNVLVGSGGVLKLADFGTAKKLEIGSVMGTRSIAGTPLWMAPEVVMGISTKTSFTNNTTANTKYDQKADIWSVGCTVVEMVNMGKPAWPEFSTLYEAIYVIGSSTGMPTNVPLEVISDDLKDFLEKCFERDVTKRWSAAMLLEHPFLIGVTASHRPAPTPAAVAGSTTPSSAWVKISSPKTNLGLNSNHRNNNNNNNNTPSSPLPLNRNLHLTTTTNINNNNDKKDEEDDSDDGGDARSQVTLGFLHKYQSPVLSPTVVSSSVPSCGAFQQKEQGKGEQITQEDNSGVLLQLPPSASGQGEEGEGGGGGGTPAPKGFSASLGVAIYSM